MKKVYCSGPLFSVEELYIMKKISDQIESEGISTFLPQRDGLEYYLMSMVNEPYLTNKAFRRLNNLTGKAIFALDIYQIVEKCDSLVFNMNGRVPDEGGVVETAIAFSIGKPLVLYKEDVRTEFNGNDNSMLTGLSYTFSYVASIEKIPSALKKIETKINSINGDFKPNLPTSFKKIVKFGGIVDKLLLTANFINLGKKEQLKILIELSEQIEKDEIFTELNWGTNI